MYENNLFKAYALIWERCAKAMQNKIISRTTFESTIYNDPIELLIAVKEHALNYQETRYEMSIISDAFRAVFNVQQKEGEGLQDYTRRFKTAREILESHLGGQIILSKYVRTMPTYEESNIDETTKLIDVASEQLFAFLYLENSDQSKYGSLLKGLNSQKSLGHDQYPRTLNESNNVLSNHKLDENKSNKTNHNKDVVATRIRNRKMTTRHPTKHHSYPSPKWKEDVTVAGKPVINLLIVEVQKTSREKIGP